MVMAIQPGPKRKGLAAEINVTPMADIMIVLLIIFMIAVPAMGTAPVALPDARHAREHREVALVVVLTARGAITVGSESMPDVEALATYVRARVDVATGSVPVLVQADRNAHYGSVVRVLDACRRAGAGDIGLATRPRVGV
jgi:biopolymer transport protein ExbD